MKKLTNVLYWAFFGLLVFFAAFGTPEASLIGAISFPLLAQVAKPLTFISLTSGLAEVQQKTFSEFLKEKGKESIEGLKAEELAGLYNEYNAEQRKALAAAIDAKASKEDIDALKMALQESTTEQMKQLNEVLKEHGLAIKRLSKPEDGGTHKSFRQQIREALDGNIENLKKLKNGGHSEAKASGFEFEVKVPGDMTIAGNVSGGNVPVEDRIEGLNTVPSRRVRLLDVMGQRSTTSNVVSWVYQANKDGSAGQTAEGNAKNQVDFDLVVANETVKKTTAFIKVSTEMLDDIEWIQSEIEQELMREVLKAVEATAYNGNGSGQNHRGIRTVASAFAAGAFAAAVDNANEVDVLTVAMNQIRIAQEGEAEPDFIFMHPTDITKLKLIKLSATDKRYVDRLLTVGSTLVLDGVPIIPTTLIGVGDYLIGDFSRSLLVTRSAMRFDIGLDADDFTKNLRTILGEWRGLTLVRNNDRSAFVAGTFATDAAALETV
jgi:HK97 family phage major capsid protein